MKIKYSIIEKFHNLSSTEMELLLYLAKYQDTATGIVEGVYYRDVMKSTGMCKQSFYNALNGLEEKQIISVNKNSDIDYDVCILDNACPTMKEWKEGYVNINRKVFHTNEFKQLKAHEKYMLLEFMKGTHESGHSIKIGVKELYDKFRKKLKVSDRVIRGYLHNLRRFFSIGIKHGMYYITYLHSKFSDRGSKTEERWNHEHLVKMECHRFHIRYDKKSLEDTAYLVTQYRKWVDGTSNMFRTLFTCIRESVEGIPYAERVLQSKYIHNLVKKGLSIPEVE